MESYGESFHEEEGTLYSTPSGLFNAGNKEDYLVRRFICYMDDLPPNTLREFYFEGERILLVRQRGKVYALGPRCTHQDPRDLTLVQGALGKGRVRCGQCGSCYQLSTGQVEEFPTLDPLPCYKVEVVDQRNVYVIMRPGDVSVTSDYEPQVTLPPSPRRSKQTFAIVGGGPAAAMCIEYLRKLGFTGKVIAFMKEDALPYERSKLTKQLAIQTAGDIQLRSREFYTRLEVDVFPSIHVTKVNVKDKTLERSDGGLATFDKVFIATGSEAKRLHPEIPGATDATGIYYFRTIADARSIYAAMNKDIDLVVVGSSFLGMELAATCRPNVKSLTVIGQTDYPFQKSFGPKIGGEIANLMASFGVQVKMNSKVLRVEFDPDTLAMTGLTLRSEEFIPAQMAIVCVGVNCATDLLAEAGVEMTSVAAVKVDEYLESNVAGVYAGGDIASAPLHPYFNTTTTARHYQVAMTHGRVAAANMLGLSEPLRTIPFFNVTLGHITLQVVGSIKHVEHVHLEGNLAEFKFAAYYLDGERVTAIVTSGIDGLAAKFAESVHLGKEVTRDVIRQHAWSRRLFTCAVHERDEDYTLDLARLKQMGLVF